MVPADRTSGGGVDGRGDSSVQDASENVVQYWKDQWQKSNELHRVAEKELVETRAEILTLKHQLAHVRHELDHCRKAHFPSSNTSTSGGSGPPPSQRETHLHILATKPSDSEEWRRSWESVQDNLLDYIAKGLITSDLAIPLPLISLPQPGDLFDVQAAQRVFTDASGPALSLFLGDANSKFLPAVRDFQQPREAITKDVTFNAIAKRMMLGRSAVRYVPGPIFDIAGSPSPSEPLSQSSVTRAMHAEASRLWTSSSASTDTSRPSPFKFSVSVIRAEGKIMVFSVDAQDYKVVLYTSEEDRVEDKFVEKLFEYLPEIDKQADKDWSYSATALYSISRDLHTPAASAIVGLRLIHLLAEQPTLTPSRYAQAIGLSSAAQPPTIDGTRLGRLQDALVLLIYHELKRLTTLSSILQRK